MAREVTVDDSGLANGVSYIDKTPAATITCAAALSSSRERVRVGAPAAQFEIIEVPPGPGEFDRRRRSLPHGLDRDRRARVHSADDEQRPAQRRRRQRRPSLYAVVARQQEAGFSARLSHRNWRRPSHAGLAARSTACTCITATSWPADCGRRLRQSAQGRLPQLLRRHGRLFRPRRDDTKREHLL